MRPEKTLIFVSSLLSLPFVLIVGLLLYRTWPELLAMPNEHRDNLFLAPLFSLLPMGWLVFVGRWQGWVSPFEKSGQEDENPVEGWVWGIGPLCLFGGYFVAFATPNPEYPHATLTSVILVVAYYCWLWSLAGILIYRSFVPAKKMRKRRRLKNKKTKHKPELRFGGMWPILTNELDARWAVRQGMWTAIVIGVVTAAASIWAYKTASPELSELGLSLWSLADAAMFLAVAIGLFFNSRAAAVLGLLLYLLEQILVWSPDRVGNLVLMIIFVLGFINGIRGAFAFHRFKMAEGVAPNLSTEP